MFANFGMNHLQDLITRKDCQELAGAAFAKENDLKGQIDMTLGAAKTQREIEQVQVERNDKTGEWEVVTE